MHTDRTRTKKTQTINASNAESAAWFLYNDRFSHSAVLVFNEQKKTLNYIHAQWASKTDSAAHSAHTNVFKAVKCGSP